jgi:hypothetical protein
MKIKQLGFFFLIIAGFCYQTNAQTIDGNVWKNHLTSDLLPYWTTPEALGNPVGNFPTFRANDGSLIYPEDLKNNLVEGWILEQTDSLRKQFIRTISRQAYFYCVAFHITGNDTLLYYAKSGVDYLRRFIRPSGMIYPYKSISENSITPVSTNDSIHVSTQDLASVLYSFSFYYYLTRDHEVLSDLLKVKDYIFDNYTDTDGYLKWTLCNDVNCPDNKTDLAAYLEQVNGCLLLMAPLIEDKIVQQKMMGELAFFNKTMQTPLFYNAENSMIWAKTKCRSCLAEGYSDPLRVVGASTHTDYGQTIRTYWCMYLSGKLLGDTATCNFAFHNGSKILHQAFLPESGTWATSPFESQTINWWLHAELDEGAAVFSLIDKSLNSKILEHTYSFWFNHFVDKKYHEIYPELKKDGTALNKLKIKQWKNGFHTAEHALFGYITSSSLSGENVDLYFALNKSSKQYLNQVQPYYFGGEISQITYPEWQEKTILGKDFTNSHIKSKVSFRSISPGRLID